MSTNSDHTRPRVLVADDYAGIVTAVRRLLEPQCEIVGYATDGETVLEDAGRLRPDVVVVDLHLPKLNGLEVCRRLAGAAPELRTIVLTATDDPDIRDHALLTPGVSGFVPKHALATELVPAIRKAWLEAVAARPGMP
jgi:DNA-binding NarL/FixJ family response regulator